MRHHGACVDEDGLCRDLVEVDDGQDEGVCVVFDYYAECHPSVRCNVAVDSMPAASEEMAPRVGGTMLAGVDGH